MDTNTERAKGERAAGTFIARWAPPGAVFVFVILFLTPVFWFPPPGQPNDPGAGALPIIVGCALAILGVALAVNRNFTVPESLTRLAKARIGGLTVLLAAYIFSMVTFGFVASTAVFLFAAAVLAGRKKFTFTAATSVVLSVLLYLLFYRALGVFLPRGPLEMLLS